MDWGSRAGGTRDAAVLRPHRNGDGSPSYKAVEQLLMNKSHMSMDEKPLMDPKFPAVPAKKRKDGSPKEHSQLKEDRRPGPPNDRQLQEVKNQVMSVKDRGLADSVAKLTTLHARS